MECPSGKKRYRTEAQAKRRRYNKVSGSSRMKVYFCPMCKGFHLTSREPKWRKREVYEREHKSKRISENNQDT
jgi:hypothetical protein